MRLLRGHVLDAINSRRVNKRLIQRFLADQPRALPSAVLANFPQLDLGRLYKSNLPLTALKQGLTSRNALSPVQAQYGAAMGYRLTQTTDPDYLGWIRQAAQANWQVTVDSEKTRRYAVMAYWDFFSLPTDVPAEQALTALSDEALQAELIDFIDLKLLSPECHTLTQGEALSVHARYSREAILSGLGVLEPTKKNTSREGVVKLPHGYALFVTLDKSGNRFRDSIQYNDYALEPNLFHWQSQTSSAPNTAVGQQYIEQRQTSLPIWLFVRETVKTIEGGARGFINCGRVDFVSSTGAKPMNVRWRLRHDLPNFLWPLAAKLRIG